MTTVTVHPPGYEPQPRQQMPAPNPPSAPLPAGMDRITDDRGRELLVKTIGPRERMRLFKALGPTLSKIDAYVGTATLAYAVAEIDGEAVPSPANEVQIEALVERLGDDGINAVAKVMLLRMGVTDEDIEAAGGDAQLAAQIAAERKRKETIAAGKS